MTTKSIPRTTRLRSMIAPNQMSFIMEAHRYAAQAQVALFHDSCSGLSAKIVQEAGFKGPILFTLLFD